MRLIFSMTEKELTSGRKTVTRRPKASQRTIRSWKKAWDEGRLRHEAWSKIGFHPDAKFLGFIELTECPYIEKLSDMPLKDLELEGGMCETREDFWELVGCKDNPEKECLVIRFAYKGLLDSNETS